MLEIVRKIVAPLVQRLIHHSTKIRFQVRKIVRLCRPVSDNIMRPLFCYWYKKGESESTYIVNPRLFNEVRTMLNPRYLPIKESVDILDPTYFPIKESVDISYILFKWYVLVLVCTRNRAMTIEIPVDIDVAVKMTKLTEKATHHQSSGWLHARRSIELSIDKQTRSKQLLFIQPPTHA